MGKSTMDVQSSTQPDGKSKGFGSPKPENADIATAVFSAFSGQPRFGQPNQYTKMMPTFQSWDQAQFGAPTSSSKGQDNQPFVAPTQFPVANQFNTQPAPVKEEQKPQSPAYVGSEGYNAGGAD